MPRNLTLSQLLAPTATSAERTRGLMILVPPDILADAVGVKPTTLRNWSAGNSQPRSFSAIMLDDLRAAASVLIEGGLDPSRASAWLISRDFGKWEGRRPVEVVRDNGMDVIGAAHDVVLDTEDQTEDGAVEPDRKRPRRERVLALVPGND